VWILVSFVLLLFAAAARFSQISFASSAFQLLLAAASADAAAVL
jgi:uncharacterized membrane protein